VASQRKAATRSRVLLVAGSAAEPLDPNVAKAAANLQNSRRLIGMGGSPYFDRISKAGRDQWSQLFI
jgi:hypothetical protein